MQTDVIVLEDQSTEVLVGMEFLKTFGLTLMVEAEFCAERIASDGGSLQLREVDRRIGLLGRAAACFTDTRAQMQVEHPVV